MKGYFTLTLLLFFTFTPTAFAAPLNTFDDTDGGGYTPVKALYYDYSCYLRGADQPGGDWTTRCTVEWSGLLRFNGSGESISLFDSGIWDIADSYGCENLWIGLNLNGRIQEKSHGAPKIEINDVSLYAGIQYGAYALGEMSYIALPVGSYFYIRAHQDLVTASCNLRYEWR
jgi:hypothetical protein